MFYDLYIDALLARVALESCIMKAAFRTMCRVIFRLGMQGVIPFSGE